MPLLRSPPILRRTSSLPVAHTSAKHLRAAERTVDRCCGGGGGVMQRRTTSDAGWRPVPRRISAQSSTIHHDARHAGRRPHNDVTCRPMTSPVNDDSHDVSSAGAFRRRSSMTEFETAKPSRIRCKHEPRAGIWEGRGSSLGLGDETPLVRSKDKTPERSLGTLSSQKLMLFC